MCQENYNTNKKEFKQLTYKDRVKIETLYNNYKKQSLKRFVNYQILASYNYNVEVTKILLKNN